MQLSFRFQKTSSLHYITIKDYNPLILPSTGHAGDLGDTQLQPGGVPGGQPASACLGIWSSGGCHISACLGIHQPGVPGNRPASTCLGIWSLEGCHASTCLGIHLSRKSTCLDLPRDPILGRPTCLNWPGDSVSRRLSCLSLPADLHTDPGTPGSQVATVLGRISFRKIHP